MSKLFDNIYAECFSPIKVKMYDSIERKEIVRSVPCGKCYHCKITKINEWVTRMTLQSLYSKYVYFGTLTYANTNTQIFDETMPMVSNINRENKFLPTPLILRKDHLQKFFKRLRKNSGIKFQYFACGEYGGNYGRPHFHYIMWSDEIIPSSMIEDAWSTYTKSGNRITIGRIDHQDMRTDAIDLEHSYKYVCKYVQKNNFEFDKLPTKKLHEKNIRENIIGVAHSKRVYAESKEQYIKNYRPFILCSKRPAIGYEYFKEYAHEFAKGRFELFNVKGDYVFPLYYYRKTREYVCPYKTISPKNGKPNSYSNIPNVVSLLVELQNAIAFNEGFNMSNRLVHIKDNYITFPRRGEGSRGFIRISAKYFNFYDCKNKLSYHLRGDGDYNVCANSHQVLYVMPASDLIKELQHSYQNVLDAFVYQMHKSSQIRAADKMQQIMQEYKSYDDYLSARKKVIGNLLSILDQKQHYYNLTKNEF